MTTNIGILGGGGISDTHARAASGIDGVKIVAVGGVNAEKVNALAQRHGAVACADVDELLRHRLDMLLIGTPSALHANDGIKAARAGVHVLTEKPLDTTTERADALIAACASSGVKLGVFFQERFASDLVRLKAAINRGDLGRLLLGSARVNWWRPAEYYSGSRWRGTRALDGGGAVMNQGIHTIDTLLWLCGDISHVFARKAARLHSIEGEDTLVATLEFANGALMTFEATTAAYPGSPRQMELTFDQGTVAIHHDRIVSAGLRNGSLQVHEEDTGAPSSSPSPVVADVSGHRAVIEDFLQAMRNGGEPRCNGVDGRRSVAVVEALYRSAETGAPVTLSRP